MRILLTSLFAVALSAEMMAAARWSTAGPSSMLVIPTK